MSYQIQEGEIVVQRERGKPVRFSNYDFLFVHSIDGKLEHASLELAHTSGDGHESYTVVVCASPAEIKQAITELRASQSPAPGRA